MVKIMIVVKGDDVQRACDVPEGSTNGEIAMAIVMLDKTKQWLLDGFTDDFYSHTSDGDKED